MTNAHAHCQHPATKAARARCRKDRAASVAPRFSCTDCHEALQYDDREDCYVDPQGVDVCWDELSQQYHAHSVWEEITRD